MKKELQNIELIEKYLSGKLNDEEKASFENRLDTDEALRNDLEAYRDAMKSIGDVGLKNQLKEFHEELFEKSKHTFWRNPQFAVAAVVLVLIAVTAVFLTRENNETEQLFHAYFEPYPDVITMRDNGQPSFSEALNYYTEGDYQKAVFAFDKLEESSQNDFTLLYKGISYLSLGTTDKATETFKMLLDGEGEVVEQARWYLFLTYLKQNKLNDGKVLSESIKQGAYKYAESRKILERIKK